MIWWQGISPVSPVLPRRIAGNRVVSLFRQSFPA
jgi:hypothetical protein